jgi:anaerobic magnesium-protoporphyrin IX monomethyl ester cyclase
VTSVLLIYPFFKPRRDRSVFRFPPLGIGYIASSLQRAGHSVSLLDCTFMERDEALNKARAVHAEVIGIFCMVTLEADCLWFARQLRDRCQLLVAGGPLPTCDPLTFLDDFDLVVRGEGEQTMVELLRTWEEAGDWSAVAGISYRNGESTSEVKDARYFETQPRPFNKDLDQLPFPAREL